MVAAGLKIREDPMGNIFGRWEGSNASTGGNLLCTDLLLFWSNALCPDFSTLLWAQ